MTNKLKYALCAITIIVLIGLCGAEELSDTIDYQTSIKDIPRTNYIK